MHSILTAVSLHPVPSCIRCEELRVYRKEEVAWFYTKEDAFWSFSNMSGGFPIFWPLARTADNRWNSVEHLYQACKYAKEARGISADSGSTLLNIRDRIRDQASPRGAKMTQKCGERLGLVRPDWSEVRVQAMIWAVELKLHFHFHSPFGRDLLRSEGRPIVEVSRKDDFWGAKPMPDGTFVGRNVLGQVLDYVRSRHEAVRQGHFTYPGGFLLG